MSMQFNEVITEQAQIRAVLGEPTPRVRDKVIATLDEHCRAFIAQSPFVLLASTDAEGRLDVSPKGDPPGFVHVLDAQTLAVPDRLGNRRADTLQNILQTGRVGMLFLVPTKPETLRINGRARVVRDGWLRERLAMQGKQPDFAIVVEVEEAFIHCAKCMIRSQLWQSEAWADASALPSIAQVMVDHAKLPQSVEEVQALVDVSYRDNLY